MNIQLSDHFQEFIQEQIDSGEFANPSEVVREALGQLEEYELKMAALLGKLHEAFDAIQDGAGIEWNSGLMDEIKGSPLIWARQKGADPTVERDCRVVLSPQAATELSELRDFRPERSWDDGYVDAYLSEFADARLDLGTEFWDASRPDLGAEIRESNRIRHRIYFRMNGNDVEVLRIRPMEEDPED